MSHFQISWVQRWIRFMILLSVLLAGLPIQTASADSQAFTVPKATVDTAVWKALWRQQYVGAPGVEMALYSAFLIQLYKNNPALDATDAMSRISALRQKYEAAVTHGQDDTFRQNQAYDEIVRAMFDAALDTPSLTAVIKNTWFIFIDQGRLPALDSATSIAAMSQRFELLDSLHEREDALLQTALELAQQNPGFAAAFDQLTGPDLQASIKNIDATRLLLAHPAIYVPARIRDHILPDGTVVISLDELRGLSRLEFDRLDASLTNLRSTLVTIDDNQKSLLDYVKDQKKRAETEALAKAKSEETKLELEARKSALSIISNLISVSDPKLGKQVNTLLTSYTEIGDALDKWLEATAKLDGLDKLGSLSTIVMTGNILGAVMNIVSLFKSAEPTPEQQILESIGKLRQQIDDLHKDMTGRFDRIDKGLNTLFTTMQAQFNLIDVQLGHLNAKLDDVQRKLVGIELSLSRIEHNNYEFLDVGFRRPLLDAINGAIGYQARTGTQMPFQPDFVNNENIFQSWGTIHAFDALSAGPTQRDFSDGQVLAEMNAFPLDANLNYLNGWLSAHGLAPFTSDRLANPRDWTFASRAYAQLGLDWPQHIQRINPQRQADLDQVGANLEAALRHISTLDTPSGPQGNTALFSGVSAYYKAKLAQLDASLRAKEDIFLQEVQTLRLKRDTPFDLWGGLDQPLAYHSPEFDVMTCGNPNGVKYAGATHLQSVIPNLRRYMLADYLKLGTLVLCLSGSWVDERETCNPKLGCTTSATFQITIDVKFNGVSIEQRSAKYGGEREPFPDPQTYAIQLWRGTQALTKFVADSKRETPSDQLKQQRIDLLNQTSSDLQAALAALQHELYGLVFNELTSGSLHAVALELSGAKVLLDDFITLGLPRAVTQDDLMRSLLFGDQRVFDDNLTTDTYALSFVQPLTQVQILTDTRVALNQLATQRITALDELLGQYLDAIGGTTHAEAFNLITDTRLELRLSQRLAKLESGNANAGEKKLTFMPLLNR